VTILDDGAGRVPPPLDPTTSDRLLHGMLSPEDAPAGYEGVVRLVIAARRPATPEEVVGVDAAVLAAKMILRDRRPDAATTLIDRTARVRMFVRMKVAAAAVAGMMVGTSGLAAANVLPDPIQHVASRVLETVGIDVPDPENHGQDVSETARTTGLEGRDKGEAVSSVAKQSGRSDEEHGNSDEEQGRSDEQPGNSDAEHGKSNEDHGKSNEDHGKSDEDHGKSDEEHGKSDEDRGNAPGGNAGTNGGGAPEDKGNGKGNDTEADDPAGTTGTPDPEPDPAEPEPGNGDGNGNGNGNGDGNDPAEDQGGGNGKGNGPPG
jgi:hypothetical protein